MMTGAEAFATLLNPISLASFRADYWEQAICHVAREDRERYRGLVSLDEIERGLVSGHFNRATFRLSNSGSLNTREYTSTRRYSPNKVLADTLDSERIFDEFARGASMVLTFAETSIGPISTLSHATATVFGSPTEGHVIVTPPSARGPSLDLHYDIVDVFALQVSGRKRWRVYAPSFPLPLPQQRNIGIDDIGEADLVADVLLGPGDTLYIPRGFPHIAELVEGVSMHVAIGVRPTTVFDALRETVDAMLDELRGDLQLRRALSWPRIDEHDDEHDVSAVEAGLDRVRTGLDPNIGVERLRQQRRRQQPCMSTGRLIALAEIEAMDVTSTITLGVNPIMSEVEGPGGGQAWRLEANEHALLLPAKFELALAQLIDAGGPLRLAELEGLDPSGQLMLGKLLVRKGVGAWLDPPPLDVLTTAANGSEG